VKIRFSSDFQSRVQDTRTGTVAICFTGSCAHVIVSALHWSLRSYSTTTSFRRTAAAKKNSSSRNNNIQGWLAVPLRAECGATHEVCMSGWVRKECVAVPNKMENNTYFVFVNANCITVDSRSVSDNHCKVWPHHHRH